MTRRQEVRQGRGDEQGGEREGADVKKGNMFLTFIRSTQNEEHRGKEERGGEEMEDEKVTDEMRTLKSRVEEKKVKGVGRR